MKIMVWNGFIHLKSRDIINIDYGLNSEPGQIVA